MWPVDLTKPYNPYITVDYLDPTASTDSRIYTSAAANVGKLTEELCEDDQSDDAGQGAALRFQHARSNPDSESSPSANAQHAAKTPFLAITTTLRTRPGKTHQQSNNTPPGIRARLCTIPVQLADPPGPPTYQPSGTAARCRAHKPHELTHTFVQARERVPYSSTGGQLWLNQTSRLYRFLEMIETQSRLPGATVGGRIPGKVNINTLWDPRSFPRPVRRSAG